MSAAEKFFNLLEQKEWVPKEVLQRLRRQAARAPTPISPQSLAKQLVQAGHLTSSQAQRLLAELQDLGGLEPATPKASAPESIEPSQEPKSSDAFTSFLEEELGLAPLEEESPKSASQPPGPAGPIPPKPPGGAKPAGQIPGEKLPGKPAEQPPAKVAKPRDQPPAKAPTPGAAGPPQPPGKAPAKPTPEKAGPAEPASQRKPAPSAAPTSKQRAAPPVDKPAEEASPFASLLEEELGALETPPGGPGDLESLLAGAATETTAPLGPLAPVAPRGGFWSRLFGRAARPSRRRWDSPLILVGSGALVILVLVGIVLILVLRRESGDLLLEAANKDFADGAYSQAIYKYHQFLGRFGRHPAASLARVRRGIAQLRQVVEEGRDWTKAFQTAQEVLEEIAGEEAFREAHVHLSSLLPKIAQGLAGQAEKQSKPDQLSLAHQALELLDRYVPRSLHDQVEIDEIRGQLGQLARRFDEQAETEKVILAIHQAIQADRPPEGYRLASSHLRQYPEAAKRAEFRETLSALKECFQKQLRRLEPNRPAQTEPPVSSIHQTIPLAAASGQPIANLEQQVVVISLNGCVYGLEAASGHLLWRRWTGPTATGRSPEPQPLPVGADPQCDLIVAGESRKELWRLERATGRIRWRSVLGGPLAAPPVVARNHLLAIAQLPEDRSRLEWIDLQTGTAVLAVELPQKVEVAPGVDLRQDRIYLVGEYWYIWVLSFSEGQCLQIIRLDHAPGTVLAPPVVLADWLLVVENHRLDQAIVKLLEVGQPSRAGQTGSPILFQDEIPGHVDLPPIAADQRLVVLSDRGAIRVYEIQSGGGKTPLARVAQRGPEGPSHLIRFGLLVGRELWVAGAGLDRFEVQSAQGRLEFRPLQDPESSDIFLQTPILLEKAVVHVRRRPGMPGVWVGAVEAQKGQRLWQTQLAVPPAGEPILPADGADNLWVISQTGQIFAVDLAARTSQLLVPSPVLALPKLPARGNASELSAGPGRGVGLPNGDLLFLFSPPTDRWFLLEKKDGSPEWKPVVVPNPLANWPTPFANGLLVPTQAGRIELRDHRSGQELLAPFQPPLEPGRMPLWSQPVIIPSQSPAPPTEKGEPASLSAASRKASASQTREVASNGSQGLPDPPKAASGGKEVAASRTEFLVSDGLGRIYRVGIAETPKPHLKAFGWVDFPGGVVSRVAVVGQYGWLVKEPFRWESSSGGPSPFEQNPSGKTSPGPGDAELSAQGRSASPPDPLERSASKQPARPASLELGGSPSPEWRSGSEEVSWASEPSGPQPAGSSQKEKSLEGEAAEGKREAKPIAPRSRLIRLALPGLEPSEAAVLEGRCIWGPKQIGVWMILATDAGQYILADSQGQIVANLSSPTERPVGEPVGWEGGIVVACRMGEIVFLRPEGGSWNMDTLVHIKRPLASGPVIVQDRLVVLGEDGTVYALSLPELLMRKKSPAAAPTASDAEKVPAAPSGSESEKPTSASPVRSNPQNLPANKEPLSLQEPGR